MLVDISGVSSHVRRAQEVLLGRSNDATNLG